MNENERMDVWGDIYEPEIEFPPEFDEPKEPEPTPENTSCYVRDLDGVLWFYCMNWRTRVREFFPEEGKTIGELIEDAVKTAARTVR